MAAVWAGPAALGAFKAGDGAASVAVELVGEHATLTLTLVIDPEPRLLRQLADVARSPFHAQPARRDRRVAQGAESPSRHHGPFGESERAPERDRQPTTAGA